MQHQHAMDCTSPSLLLHSRCAGLPARRPWRQQQRGHSQRSNSTSDSGKAEACTQPTRRQALSHAGLLASGVLLSRSSAQAAPPPAEDHKILCDQECVAQLDKFRSQTLKSGVRTVDIKEGTGVEPRVGYQVVVNYVAMTGKGLIFDSSLDKGRPYDIRLGTGQVVSGLDEGIKGMRTGGIRRVFIPGNLGFPKGLPSGPGKPRIAPGAPLIFDVELVYCPGLDDE